MNQAATPGGRGAREPAQTPPVASAISNLTHELANPLNAIAISTELARRMLARGQVTEAARTLQHIGADCERCSRLLRDAQDYFSIEVAQTQCEVELQPLLDDSSRSLAGRGEIAWRGSPAAEKLRGDSSALCRMFRELLRNAFDHGASRVELEAQRGDGEINVRISDDGAGIDPALLPRIFDPFFSAQRQQHSGVGLSIARMIAQAHGGDIVIENAGQGTVFRVTLPMSK